MSYQQMTEQQQYEEEMDTPKVYAAIASVMKDLSVAGLSKNNRNSQQGYNFRGIDDAYNVLAPILSRHGLVILPRVLNRTSETRKSAKGGDLFYVTVEAEFDLIAADDGSRHTVKTFGEAMDSADKATNKAMSAAYKYMAFQAFCIPTQGDNDADGTTHEVAPQALSERAIADHLAAIEAAATSDALKKAWTAAQTAAKTVGDSDAFHAFKEATAARKEALSLETA
jgi:hypothetical protein